MKEKIAFFIVFYLLLGTLGITIPGVDYYLKNGEIATNDIAIGLITIVVSTVGYSAARIIIKSNEKRELFWNIVALALSIVCNVFVVILLSNNRDDLSLILSGIAYFLSLILWWYQNRNEDFVNPTNPLGGVI